MAMEQSEHALQSWVSQRVRELQCTRWQAWQEEAGAPASTPVARHGPLTLPAGPQQAAWPLRRTPFLAFPLLTQNLPKTYPSLRTSPLLLSILLSHERRDCKESEVQPSGAIDGAALTEPTVTARHPGLCPAVPPRGGRGPGALCRPG